MITSLDELRLLLNGYTKLANDEISSSNLCVLNYLRELNINTLMSYISPHLFLRNCVNACTANDMIIATLKEIDNELSTRYGFGLHHP